MSILFCAGSNNKGSSGVPHYNAPADSSILNAPASNACTNECRLFQEHNEDAPDRRPLDDAEKIIANGLFQLSHKERQDVLHDIHGVADTQHESHEFVVKSKNDLEMWLVRNQKQSQAFCMVWNLAPNYVRGLYLTFLRCDAFDIPKTGKRVFLHFDTKLWLFGEQKLCRDIVLDDFDHHDMQCYKAGLFQILPVRDRAGRAICIKLWKLQKFHCRENVWRQLFYNHMVLLKDEETQLKGLVQIVYNVNDQWKKTFDKELYVGVAKIRAATPIRVVSIHYCFNDAAFGAIIKVVSLALEMHTRTRTRLHYGTDVEVQYELQGFGIPLKELPVTSDGKFRLKEHANWIKMLKAQESFKNFSKKAIIVPTHSDVLFGRGKVLQNHIGNLRFSNILEEEMERYFEAKRTVKLTIAKEIAARIAGGGGRFVRQDNDGVWEEVDEPTAIDKVGHGFRNRKPPTATSSRTPTRLPQEKRPVSPSDESSCASSHVADAPKAIQDAALPFSQNYTANKRSRFDTDDEKEEKTSDCHANMENVGGSSDRPARVCDSDVPEDAPADLPENLDEVPLDLEDFHEFSESSLDKIAGDIW